jgi:hypothetical protein
MFDAYESLPAILTQCDAVADSDFVSSHAIVAASAASLLGLGIPTSAVSSAEATLSTLGLSSLISQAQDAYHPSTLQLPPAASPYPDTLTTHRFRLLVS